jgi:hypothetical protein
MKKLEKLNGMTVKAKYFGKEIDCIISIEGGYLYFCHDTMPDGLDEAYYERAKVLTEHERTYKTAYKSGLSQDWELIDDELGIYAFGRAEKINLNAEESNFIEAVCASRFIAPKLKKIYGSFILGFSPDAKTVDCSKLEYVGGDLSIFSTKAITLPKLKTVGSGLDVKYSTSLTAPVLEVVNCDIKAHKAKNIKMPMLKKASNLKVSSVKTIDLPNLEIGAVIFANSAAKINMPKLRRCDGLYVNSVKAINFPKLKVVGWLQAPSAKAVDLPRLEAVMGSFNVAQAETVILPKISDYWSVMYSKKTGQEQILFGHKSKEYREKVLPALKAF